MEYESNQNEAKNQEDIMSECLAPYRPQPYRQAFPCPPGNSWKIDASFDQGYFESARLILTGVSDGKLRHDVEGVVGVFLSRHYLELAIKYALFHSRWLKDEGHNTGDREVAPVGKQDRHLLQNLWDKLHGELTKRMPSIFRTGLDLDYVAWFVAEFQKVDKDGWRFRYPVKEFAVTTSSQRKTAVLNVDFEALLFSLKHVRSVLEALDTQLIEQYGKNEEWEAELNSL